MGVINMVSGALNPCDARAQKHAKKAYEAIRKRTTDIYYISRNTQLSYEQVSLIKQYIFSARHVLDGEVNRFAASYEMAESWRRLASKTGKGIQPHDVLMLYHEMLEIKYVLKGNSQHDAHELASKKYDYGKASNEYYRSLGFKI